MHFFMPYPCLRAYRYEYSTGAKHAAIASTVIPPLTAAPTMSDTAGQYRQQDDDSRQK